MSDACPLIEASGPSGRLMSISLKITLEILGSCVPPPVVPRQSQTPPSIRYLPAVVECRDNDGENCQRHLGAGLAQVLQVGECLGHAADGPVLLHQAHSCGGGERERRQVFSAY